MIQIKADELQATNSIVTTIPGKSSYGNTQDLSLELTTSCLRCTIENPKYPSVKNIFEMALTDKNLGQIRGFTLENREAKVDSIDGTYMTMGNPADDKMLSVMIHKSMDPAPDQSRIVIEMCQVNVPQQSLKNILSSYWS